MAKKAKTGSAPQQAMNKAAKASKPAKKSGGKKK